MPTARAVVAAPTQAAEAVSAPSEPLRIKVKVTRRPTGSIRIEWGTLPPGLNVDHRLVRECLPREHARKIPVTMWGRYSFTDLVARDATIPLSVWADALGAAAVLTIKAQGEAVFDSGLQAAPTLGDLLSGSSHLAVGGYLYKLQPVAAIPANRALATMRAKLAAEVKQHREQLVEGAQKEAQIIVEQAEAVRREVDEARRVLRQDGILQIPQWALGYAMETRGGPFPFALRTNATFVLVDLRYERENGQINTWNLPGGGWVTPVHLYLPVNFATGEYSLAREGGSYIRTTRGEAISLPHITSNGTCLQPVGLPPVVRRREDIAQVVSLLVRAHRTVNLNSLMSRVHEWPQALRESLPHDILEGRWDVDNPANARVTTRQQERATTWTLRDEE